MQVNPCVIVPFVDDVTNTTLYRRMRIDDFARVAKASFSRVANDVNINVHERVIAESVVSNIHPLEQLWKEA